MSAPWGKDQPLSPGQVPPGTNPSAPPGMVPPGMPNMMYNPYPHPQMMPPPYGVPQPAPGQQAPYYHPGVPQPFQPYGNVPPVVPAQAAPVTVELSREDQLRFQVENSLGTNKPVTVFVGNIADGVTDELLNSIFSICGPVKRWKRMLEASGSPKSFGFLDFQIAEGLLRLIRLLSNVPLLGKNLNIKIEQNTKDYLAKYQEALKEYEISHPDSPRLSYSLEDDLKCLDELTSLFKQRNLISAMQFVEHRVEEMTTGSTIKALEPVFEHPKDSDEHARVKPEPKKPKKASLTGWEAPGYRDREKRWEAKEASMMKSREQERARNAESDEKEKIERLKLIDWIRNFDDSSFFHQALDLLTLSDDRNIERHLSACHAPSFYIDRSRWRERRQRDLHRQLDFDAREEARDAEQPSKQTSKSKKTRPALVPISYNFDELLNAGYDAEAAKVKLQELKKDKIKALIAKIPTEREALFAWDMDWELMDLEKVKSWIVKNVDSWEEVKEKAILTEDLLGWLKARVRPEEILQHMDGLPEADIFVLRLWRYLVYETEATGYGLQ